jgi:hypothetical protein
VKGKRMMASNWQVRCDEKQKNITSRWNNLISIHL